MKDDAKEGTCKVVTESPADQRASLHEIPNTHPKKQSEIYAPIADKAMQGGNYD